VADFVYLRCSGVGCQEFWNSGIEELKNLMDRIPSIPEFTIRQLLVTDNGHLKPMTGLIYGKDDLL
jgi:hypothetical protein